MFKFVIRNFYVFIAIFMCAQILFSGIPALSYAQESEASSIDLSINEGSDSGFMLHPEDASPLTIDSLFFTPEALALLNDAINGLNVTPLMAKKQNEPPKDPGIRELALGGIVHKSASNWTIWLNGKRITPKAIPEQVFDLIVHKEYIEIKWFDEYTNRIFPIRLRPNERFNMDSRLFLTGTHAADQKL